MNLLGTSHLGSVQVDLDTKMLFIHPQCPANAHDDLRRGLVDLLVLYNDVVDLAHLLERLPHEPA